MFVIKVEVAAAVAALVIGSSMPMESEQYRRQVLADKALRPVEQLSRYHRYDFSPLWLKTDNENILGFIGNDYQRLRIKLLTARPDPRQPGRYSVTGKSKVKDNLLPFEGTFRLLHVREAAALPEGLDGAAVPAVKTGVMLAEYELKEPAGQQSAGVFRGILSTNWYLDRSGKMQYDDLRQHADAFSNNQCVGTWQSYKTNLTKRCNWGDHRIPAAAGLDQGAGEFSPADKYVANGWQSYRQAWADNDAEARRQEKAEWWK
ncbi:hypothetical protein KBK19_14500 [Microvirga sp. STR05]|uniref:GLPGLI family protein n=1 Tax=Hymenobacter duratus TaxID=2771356 RepID=A0ABR8JJJ0_9BACT|nr:hypothetical protein [Hymenobacter duratus]MBD2716247.1 hypothetical protein [Hymenobacter duratus]MBR7951163.1 hypothetical protein [Microvirga sp. STR05]